MKVVHCMREEYDVYIGRGQGPRSAWGNPFTHEEGTFAKHKVATREEAVEKYREYILNSPHLIGRLHELRDKVLGCWCAGPGGLTAEDTPFKCHGQILLQLLRKQDGEK